VAAPVGGALLAGEWDDAIAVVGFVCWGTFWIAGLPLLLSTAPGVVVVAITLVVDAMADALIRLFTKLALVLYSTLLLLLEVAAWTTVTPLPLSVVCGDVRGEFKTSAFIAKGSWLAAERWGDVAAPAAAFVGALSRINTELRGDGRSFIDVFGLTGLLISLVGLVLELGLATFWSSRDRVGLLASGRSPPLTQLEEQMKINENINFKPMKQALPIAVWHRNAAAVVSRFIPTVAVVQQRLRRVTALHILNGPTWLPIGNIRTSSRSRRSAGRTVVFVLLTVATSCIFLFL
jgi:hypothetical protein